jgi:hypothetical protein
MLANLLLIIGWSVVKDCEEQRQGRAAMPPGIEIRIVHLLDHEPAQGKTYPS